MLRMVKTTYGEVKKLSSPEAAYIAALIDGEETIGLGRHNKSEYRRPEVEISNTDFRLLKWVKELVGAGQITQKRTYNKKHAIGFCYRICSRQALNLLFQISPYLRTYKRKRAELILKNYTKLTPRNGKYSSKLLLEKERFIKAFFAITQNKVYINNLTSTKNLKILSLNEH